MGVMGVGTVVNQRNKKWHVMPKRLLTPVLYFQLTILVSHMSTHLSLHVTLLENFFFSAMFYMWNSAPQIVNVVYLLNLLIQNPLWIKESLILEFKS